MESVWTWITSLPLTWLYVALGVVFGPLILSKLRTIAAHVFRAPYYAGRLMGLPAAGFLAAVRGIRDGVSGASAAAIVQGSVYETACSGWRVGTVGAPPVDGQFRVLVKDTGGSPAGRVYFVKGARWYRAADHNNTGYIEANAENVAASAPIEKA